MTEVKHEMTDEITPSPSKRRRVSKKKRRKYLGKSQLEALDTRLKFEEIIKNLSPKSMSSLAGTSKTHEYQTRRELKVQRRQKECRDGYENLRAGWDYKYNNIFEKMFHSTLVPEAAVNQLVRDVFALDCPGKVDFISLIMERYKLYYNHFPSLDAFRELATLDDWIDVLKHDTAEKLTDVIEATLTISDQEKMWLFRTNLDSVAWALMGPEKKEHRDHEYKIFGPYLDQLNQKEVIRLLQEARAMYKDELTVKSGSKLDDIIEKFMIDNYNFIKQYFNVKEEDIPEDVQNSEDED